MRRPRGLLKRPGRGSYASCVSESEYDLLVASMQCCLEAAPNFVWLHAHCQLGSPPPPGPAQTWPSAIAGEQSKSTTPQFCSLLLSRVGPARKPPFCSELQRQPLPPRMAQMGEETRSRQHLACPAVRRGCASRPALAARRQRRWVGAAACPPAAQCPMSLQLQLPTCTSFSRTRHHPGRRNWAWCVGPSCSLTRYSHSTLPPLPALFSHHQCPCLTAASDVCIFITCTGEDQNRLTEKLIVPALQLPAQRYRMALLPTPIHPWAAPGVPPGCELHIKRDDLTGMQLSGNKVGGCVGAWVAAWMAAWGCLQQSRGAWVKGCAGNPCARPTINPFHAICCLVMPHPVLRTQHPRGTQVIPNS